ncbi:MAG: hypothetical protein DRJ10_08215 [Bacteroidetes bacterium]|nr:MAG: hypothetical protein DRJ10_08215 [Bacteroidota bacterium]
MGATVKLMLNPTRKNSQGKRTISLRVTINRKRIYYSMGYQAHDKHWSDKLKGVKKEFDPQNQDDINDTLEYNYSKAVTILKEIKLSGKPVTHEQFRKRFFNISSANSVLEYYDEVVDDLNAKGKIGNALNYRQSREAFSRFVNNRLVKFEDVDVAFLNRWERKLSKTCSGNGISNYMRTLRALINRAISENICSSSTYPFKSNFNHNGYRISKLETSTRKRALSEEDLEKLKQCDSGENESLIDAKNIFFFSFYTMGMNVIDICFLKESDIIDGRIRFERSKNSKPHNIKILDPVQEILDYYQQFDFGTKYLFPALKQEHITEAQKKRRAKDFNRYINNNLKKLGELAGISNPQELTTYVARHSWATTMKRRGVPRSLISEAMQHTDEKTTQIYLDSFENERVDEMNEKLL